MTNKIKNGALFCILFLIMWGLCITRIAPTFNTDDSPETVTAFKTLGIQHPPGYPLDTMIGKIFTLIPIGNVMLRGNMTSSFFFILSSLCLLLFVKNFYKSGENKFINLLFAIQTTALFFLCYVPFVQASSTKGSIYMLNAFLTIIFLISLSKMHENVKFFYLALFIFGISMANHLLSTIVLVPAVIYYLWRYSNLLTIEKIRNGVLLLLTGSSAYIYLIIRSYAFPVYSWGDPRTLKGFLWLVMLDNYNYASVIRSLYSIAKMFWYYISDIVPGQYPYFTFLFSIPGVYYLYTRQKNLFVLMFFSYLLSVGSLIYMLSYLMGTETYWAIKPLFTTSFIYLSVFISSGIYFVLNIPNVNKIIKIITNIVFVTGLIALLCTKVPDYSRYYIGYDYIQNTLLTLPKKAIYFADGELSVFGSQYARIIEKSSIVPVNTFSLMYDWYRNQLKKYNSDEIIIPDRKDNGFEDLKSVMETNSDKEIFYSYTYAKERKLFPFSLKGIIHEVVVGDKKKEPASPNYYYMYSYRGIISNKIKFDEFTINLAVNVYSSAFLDSANELYTIGKYKEAAQLYRWSDLFLPNYDKRLNLGNCYFYLNDIDGAGQYWLHAIELNPKSAVAYSNMAYLFYSKRDYKKAMEYVNSALKYDPNDQNARNLIAKIEQEKGIH